MTTEPEHEAAAAYVLGSLSSEDRLAFEEHLGSCEACTRDVMDFSALPGLLAQIDERDLDEPSETVRENVLAAATGKPSGLRRSRTRWRVGAVVAAAAAAVLAGIIVFTGDESDPQPQFAADSEELVVGSDYEGLTGSISLSERSWGTLILVDLFDAPHRDEYTMWAVADDGSWTAVADWRWSKDGTCRVPGATSLAVGEISRVVVTGLHDRDDDIAWGT